MRLGVTVGGHLETLGVRELKGEMDAEPWGVSRGEGWRGRGNHMGPLQSEKHHAHFFNMDFRTETEPFL